MNLFSRSKRERRLWNDFQMCDRRRESSRQGEWMRGVSDSFKRACQDLANRGCSPLNWEIRSCPVRRIALDGNTHYLCSNLAVVSIKITRLEGDDYVRAMRQAGWDDHYRDFLCEFCRYQADRCWKDELRIREAERAVAGLSRLAALEE